MAVFRPHHAGPGRFSHLAQWPLAHAAGHTARGACQSREKWLRQHGHPVVGKQALNKLCKTAINREDNAARNLQHQHRERQSNVLSVERSEGVVMSANIERQRILVAQECARIMLEEGVHDFAMAKHKASQRLRVVGRRHLPSNREIEAAMQDHRRLFFDEEDRAALHELRERALQAMQLLEGFQPRLVGAALNGTAGLGSRAVLHVFAEAVEDVIFVLMDRRISYRESERVLREGRMARAYPALLLRLGDEEVEVVVFPSDGLRRAPPSPVDGRPMRRADMAELRRLMASGGVPA
ncbi:hypothetical protein [Acidihalobacter prosperus]|nr:hypothetical protein [Acidihalobacter prosperus]